MPSMYSDSLRAFLKPILPYLDDPEVSEILINGPTEIWVEKSGKLARVNAQFTEEGLGAATRNIAQFVGRVLNDERPRMDARLPDGSRIHVVMPPISRRGTMVAIRKFTQESLSMQKILDLGTVSSPVAKFIEAIVAAHQNILISGGSGAGKTSLLNVFGTFIAQEERIVVIEDSAELQVNQPQVVFFESRPPDKNGKGEVTLADLLNSALRVRPDRILVGEVRGGEAFSLLQAMNTGHSGSIATTHANTAVDTLRRIESLCLMSGLELPLVAIRAQVASAVHLVVTCERLSDGSRKVTSVSEVLPLTERGEYRVQDLFVYTAMGKDASGRVQGYHAPTGIVPQCLLKLRAAGFPGIDESFFDPATYRLPQPPMFRADAGAETKWAPSIRDGVPGERPTYTFNPEASTINTVQPEIRPSEPPPPPVEERVESATIVAMESPLLHAEPPAAMSSRANESTIQISADLISEMESLIAQEPTNTKRVPIAEEKTDPHIRVPNS